VVAGVTGADEVQRRYGSHIFSAHLPQAGQHTQPVDAGYRANGYVYAVHDDYDACKAMMADIGERVRIRVR
jgi:hypothetical protein